MMVRMAVALAAAAVAAAAAATGDAPVVLQSAYLRAAFNVPAGGGAEFGSLASLRAPDGPELLRGGAEPLWSAVVATADGQQTLTAGGAAAVSHTQNATALTLQHRFAALGVDVVIHAALNGPLLDITPEVAAAAGNVTLVSWTVTLSPVALKQTSYLLENIGFGVLHACGVLEAKAEALPPCTWTGPEKGYLPGCPDGSSGSCPSAATLSAAQAGCDASPLCTGVTRRADGSFEQRGGAATQPSPSGEESWRISNYAQCRNTSALPVTCKGFGKEYPAAAYQFIAAYDGAQTRSGVYFATHDPHGATKHFNCAVRSLQAEAAITTTTYVPNSTLPLSRYVAPYAVSLAVFDGDWWDAARLYRRYALTFDWAKAGPVSKRADVPGWINDVPVWVNSHWQQLDIFNTTGGDPQVVLNTVRQVQQRLGLGATGPQLGLHWYEWDTLGYELGSNYTKCDPREPTCGFDTHYPEYFPTRVGFASAVKQLQAWGVRVAPYINGRIFDVGTETWTTDGAARYAAKRCTDVKLNPPASDLARYEESYGSHAVFNVMCPSNDYWQEKLANVTAKLLNEFGVDGVYIDEVAAADARLCWDPSHGHALGGGDHWVTGYAEMMRAARQKQQRPAVYLTESNSEPFMAMFTVYLTLVGFLNAESHGARSVVNAFGAAYGGYYYAMGAEFYETDFAPDPNVFSAKVATQFHFGAMLGWFSLLGRSNERPGMGLLPQLLDPRHDPEVAFLRRLVAARGAAAAYFTDGSASRDLHPAVTVGGRPLPRAGAYRRLIASAYLSAGEETLLLLLSNVDRSAAQGYALSVDPRRFGLAAPAPRGYALAELESGKVVAKFAGGVVEHNATLASHDVHMLVVSVL